MAERKKILWLVSWYPNKNDAFDGDFIQRHARAAAIYNDVYVIYVTDAIINKQTEEEFNYVTGLTEQFIYFKKPASIVSKFTKQWHWYSLYKKAVETFIINNGLPHFVHVHVPWKAGLIALWIKQKYKIPFIVTEHFGIYNEVLNENFNTKTFYVRTFVKKIFQQASAITSVSKYVGEGIRNMVLKKDYTIIPNVVDTTLFYYKEEKYSKFTFLHVSNMVPLKNVEGILNAFVQLITIAKVTDVQLIFIGNKNHYYNHMAERMGLLNKYVFFKGEVAYAEVAKEMQLSHCLIINSDIENSPCVIGEALCCGLPVIATNVGGIPELVNETNSYLINSRDDKGLAMVMLRIMEKWKDLNKKKISDDAKEKFNYAAIGKKFDDLYRSL